MHFLQTIDYFFIHILKHGLRKHYKSDLGGRKNQRLTMVRNIVLLSFIHKVSVKQECRVLTYRIWSIMSDHMISLIKFVILSFFTLSWPFTWVWPRLIVSSFCSVFSILRIVFWIIINLLVIVVLVIVLFVLISTASDLVSTNFYYNLKWFAIKQSCFDILQWLHHYFGSRYKYKCTMLV